MSNSLTFEAEPFELSPPASGEKPCHCTTCQAQREQEFPEDDETAEDFAFEDELFGEYAPPPQGASYGSGQASYGAAAAWAPLTAEKICWVQNVLNRAEGENLKPDGIFGPLTRGAVQRFQSRQSLKTDGIVGPQTETALIQTALNTIAQASLVPVNGTMDARTHQEIRRFQTERRLVVDGIVGPVTRAAMIAAMGGRCQIAYRPPPPPPPKREKIPHLIPIDPRTPIAPPTCNRAELARRVDACVADTKRCLIEAGQDLALALAACKGNPLCNAAAVGKSLLTMKRCREALLRCDAAAKAATNCK